MINRKALMEVSPQDFERLRREDMTDARLLAVAAILASLMRWNIGEDGLPRLPSTRIQLLVLARKVIDAYLEAERGS